MVYLKSLLEKKVVDDSIVEYERKDINLERKNAREGLVLRIKKKMEM